MKRWLAFSLCLALVLSLMPAARATEVIEICDAAGMAALSDNPAGCFRLTEDIDMAGVDWTPFSFSGTLDGDGHTVYNLSVSAAGTERAESYDGNFRVYDTVFAGLFSQLTGSVCNLKLRGLLLSVESDENCFVGGIAGYCYGAALENCVVEGRLRLYSGGTNGGVGGLFGFGCADVEKCETDVELLFEDRSAPEHRCEQFMGGLYAAGLGNASGCSIRLDGYISCHGYVHSGGVAGLYDGMKLENRRDYRRGTVNCEISGKIRFFENNPDRRAYCSSGYGETLIEGVGCDRCVADFVRDEVFTYDTPLSPESCPVPDYTETVTDPSCSAWGYTDHCCTGCGYTWRDSYTPPAHHAGDWETETAPSRTSAGSRLRRCTYCGEVVEREELPRIRTAEALTLAPSALALRYKDSALCTAALYPADCEKTALLWSSSDESVFTVDSEGRVTAVGEGSAELRCDAADGSVSAVCPVTVTLTFLQRFIRVCLFGWLWY